MCSESALFAPTYDLTQTSRLHLEHAATAPHRFSDLLMKAGSLDLQDAQKVHAISKRLLELRLPRSSAANFGFNAGENVFREFHLLPGGRFLLARSSESVHFWDLGTNATDMVEPFPICHRRIKDLLGAKETPRTLEPDGPSMAVFPCVTKPNAMRFTYSLQDAVKAGYQSVYLFEATFTHSPLAVDVRLMKTYADRDGTFPLVHAVTDEWIVMSFLDDIRILNYMDNTMAFWTAQNADDVERVIADPETDSVVVVTTKGEVRVYEIEAFYENLTHEDLVCCSADDLPYTSLESESPRAVALLEPWYYIGAYPQSIVLDTLVGDEIRRYAGAHTSNGRWLALELRRHSTVQVSAQSLGAVADAAITGDARATFPFCKVDEECGIVPYARHSGIECLAYRGVPSSLAGQAVTASHSTGTLSPSAGTSNPGTGGPASVVATQLFSSLSLSGMLKNVALDAASGRLCFIDDDDERNIWIIDFLLPQREG
ncbi:hypothetical protein EV121DRAFT_286684 [Schizophyllum commune]